MYVYYVQLLKETMIICYTKMMGTVKGNKSMQKSKSTDIKYFN